MKRITTNKRSKKHTQRVAADARRHALRTMGVDPWLVAATPDNELYDLLHRQLSLELVDDVEPVSGWYPRLVADSTPDEVASVLTFTTGRLVEVSEVTGMTPWGGDAA